MFTILLMNVHLFTIFVFIYYILLHITVKKILQAVATSNWKLLFMPDNVQC